MKAAGEILARRSADQGAAEEDARKIVGVGRKGGCGGCQAARVFVRERLRADLAIGLAKNRFTWMQERCRRWCAVCRHADRVRGQDLSYGLRDQLYARGSPMWCLKSRLAAKDPGANCRRSAPSCTPIRIFARGSGKILVRRSISAESSMRCSGGAFRSQCEILLRCDRSPPDAFLRCNLRHSTGLDARMVLPRHMYQYCRDLSEAEKRGSR